MGGENEKTKKVNIIYCNEYNSIDAAKIRRKSSKIIFIDRC